MSAIPSAAPQGTAMLELHAVEALNDAADLISPAGAESRLPTVCVVGLGYVGLPVAVAFGKVRDTVGYDLSTRKIRDLKKHEDPTGEVASDELRAARKLEVTDDPEKIARADFIIVAVPTPVNAARQPDLSPLEGASR